MYDLVILPNCAFEEAASAAAGRCVGERENGVSKKCESIDGRIVSKSDSKFVG